MTFNTQFSIPSFNISLRDSPPHTAIAEAFAKEICIFSSVCW